jgi:RimJ/RimL family protein N-acetyltransferase
MGQYLAPPVQAPLDDVETDRLILRRFLAEDLDALTVVFARAEVWQYPYGRGFTREETARFLDAQLAEWAEVDFGCWVAILKATNEVIGYVGLSVPMFLPEILPAVEVGWRFSPDHWGAGLATEGAVRALKEGFETLGLAEICSLPQSINPRSYQVCERLGMRFERSIDCPATEHRGPVEARLYNMTADDWQATSK